MFTESYFVYICSPDAWLSYHDSRSRASTWSPQFLYLQPVHLHQRSDFKYKVPTPWPRMLQFEPGGSKYPYLPYCSIKNILIGSVAVFSDFSMRFTLGHSIGWEVYCTLIHCNSMEKMAPIGYTCFLFNNTEDTGTYTHPIKIATSVAMG